MKRPLVLVGFSVLLTLAAAAFFGGSAAFAAIWVCLGIAAASFAWSRTRHAVVVPLAFASAAAALALFCAYDASAVQPPRSLNGRTAVLSGTVCELPEFRNGKWYYTVRVDESPDGTVPAGFQVRLISQAGLGAGPYDRVSGTVCFYTPPDGEGYTSRGYYASKGVMMFAVPTEYSGLTVSPPAEKPLYYYALRLRQELIRSTKELLPQEEASLVCGVLLGDKTDLPQEISDEFRVDGVSHLLAVSGLHMSTIAQLLIFLLLFLRVPKRPASVLTACGVFGFMAVTCFVPSVTRSGVMCLLCLAAPAFSRRADPLNSLCAAGLLLCLQNPYSGADVSFLLSFCAALGLILCAGPVTAFLNARLDRFRILRPLVRPVNAVLGTSVAATLFTLPVLLPQFGLLSIVSPLANLLMLVPSTLMMSFGGTAAVLELLLPATFLSRPFALAAGLLARWLELCAAWLARLPCASVSPSAGCARLWLAAVFLLFGAAFALHGRKLLPHAACLAVILLLAGVFSYQLAKRDVTRVAVLDSGDGLSVAVTQGGHAAVIGCDTAYSGRIISYLRSQNTNQLDYFEILTANRQEFDSAAAVARSFPARVFVCKNGSLADSSAASAGESSEGTVLFSTDTDTVFQNGVRIQTKVSGNLSASLLTAGGRTFLICPKKYDISALPDSWKTADFLISDSVPAESSGAAPAVAVFSLDRGTLQQSAAGIGRFHAFWTGGYGNFIFELVGNKTLSAGREP